MLYKFLQNKISDNLPFVPNTEQKHCIELLAKFCTDRLTMQCFLLKGYAGTGKTSIVSALVRAMHELEQKTVLLAPTGRAAKVFSVYSGMEATSIHKKIYRQKSVSDFHFMLNYNKAKNTLFIVDEASMIGDSVAENNIFDSGRLCSSTFACAMPTRPRRPVAKWSGNWCRRYGTSGLLDRESSPEVWRAMVGRQR